MNHRFLAGLYGLSAQATSSGLERDDDNYCRIIITTRFTCG